jgi:ferredoxin-thioredoxin reductase catalytic subunit
VAAVRCPCFYAEVDPESEDGNCNCGHAMDEHGDDRECTVDLDA